MIFNRTVLLVIACLVVMLFGCSYFVSWDDKSRSLIGHPIDTYLQLNGHPDRITELQNGNVEYEYRLDEVDPSCVHFWIVNDKGIIINYRYQGRCRPIG